MRRDRNLRGGAVSFVGTSGDAYRQDWQVGRVTRAADADGVDSISRIASNPGEAALSPKARVARAVCRSPYATLVVELPVAWAVPTTHRLARRVCSAVDIKEHLALGESPSWPY